ncbi:MAG: MarR family winged helix-turn-helix transcriptional regulator [Lacibacter sp.]
MSNNHFKRGELYSFMTGMATTAIARRLQKNFKQNGIEITVEQWSVLYHLWKTDGLSQQQLCDATYRDKPSITRLVDNLEKLQLVKRIASKNDRRINQVFLTTLGKKMETESMNIAETTLNESLEGVPPDRIEICKEVLQLVYENLKTP